MDKTAQKRAELADQMADHLLAHGFREFTLRSIGATTGTGDRMLLHYFVDKQAVLSATLDVVTARLVAMLSALRTAPMAPTQLVAFLAALLGKPEVTPYTQLWLELTALSIREPASYKAVASQIAGTFLAWIRSAIEVAPGDSVDDASAFVVATVEGMILLHAVGRDDDARRALVWVMR